MLATLEQSVTMTYDIPQNFHADYKELCGLLEETLAEIKSKHSIQKLNELTDRFVVFYESFSSEKQVFDSLNACKSNNDPIYEHSLNVALLSRMLGDLNHMHSDDLYTLTQAALLHDIGKLLVNPEVLHKKEKLTPHEFNLIKKHTKQGYLLLHNLVWDPRISSVALMHHERCDGSGYPMGTSGININEFSRIVSICDVYAGMIASRGYRKSCCPFQIIALFEKDGLHKYDTDYTILFLRSMLDTYVGYSVELNTGEQGIITAVNPHNLSNPIIEIDGVTINLATDERRQILHII